MAELTLQQHLSRHLRFLRVSCDAFDQGHRDEAIRIAVVLRVLMHGGGGAPLLQQLSLPTLQLISTCEEIGQDFIECSGNLSYSSVTLEHGEVSAISEPKLDTGRTRNALAWRDWWDQDVYLLGGRRMTRGDIVCAAANKEGAHVVQKLPAGYKNLLQGPFTVEHRQGEGLIAAFRLEDVHLSDLRQMAHEVLSSPDLAGY